MQAELSPKQNREYGVNLRIANNFFQMGSNAEVWFISN